MMAFILGVLVGMAFEIGSILSEIKDLKEEIKLLRKELNK